MLSIGPALTSDAGNENNLTNVQFVYLAVAIAGLIVNILFITTRLPEVSEEVLEAMARAEEEEGAGLIDRPLWRQWNCIFGFVAQFCYVGAQVTVATVSPCRCDAMGAADSYGSSLSTTLTRTVDSPSLAPRCSFPCRCSSLPLAASSALRTRNHFCSMDVLTRAEQHPFLRRRRFPAPYLRCRLRMSTFCSCSLRMLTWTVDCSLRRVHWHPWLRRCWHDHGCLLLHVECVAPAACRAACSDQLIQSAILL